MKRFIVFSGDMYGQYGGMDDFTGDTDTLDEAFNLAELQIFTNVLEHTEQEYYRNNWIQIYDTQSMKMVWESGEQRKVGNESIYITLREAVVKIRNFNEQT